MRLIVARCEISYAGRLSTVLPEAVRLLMIKTDGTFMVWSDGGGSNVKPLNWMVPPTMIEERLDATVPRAAARAQAARQEERSEISVTEVLSDVVHEMDALAALEKEGVERELQELLADPPSGVARACGWCGASGRRTSGRSI